MRARFEDEGAFAKYRDLNPFAAAIMAKLAIQFDLVSPWAVNVRALLTELP